MADNMSESRMGEHGEQLGEDVSRTAQHAKSAVAEAAGRARDTVKEYGQQGYEYATEKGRQMKETTQQYIQENPWYAIGISLGVGILLGMLLRGGGGRED